MKRMSQRALMACLGGLLIACIAVAAEDAIELVDQMGAKLVIAQPVERIASISGIQTFYLYTLGKGDTLVAGWYVGVKGIAQASEAMWRIEPRLAEVLMFGTPNVEEILARDPQLVLANGALYEGFAEQMADVGIPTMLFQAETPDSMKEALHLTGLALGPEATERAEAFLVDYDRVLGAVVDNTAAVPEDERVRVLFLGTNIRQVASGDMYQRYLVEAAGGVFVSAELPGYWNTVNLEQILVWNPEVVIIPPYGSTQPPDLLDNPDWQGIDAIENGRVYRMPRLIAPWDTPVPESLLGVVWMAELLYPDRINLDFAAEADHFYREYYQFELTSEDWDVLTSQ